MVKKGSNSSAFFIIFIVTAALLIGGCSPSTLNTRYNGKSASKKKKTAQTKKSTDSNNSIYVSSNIPELDDDDEFLKKFNVLKEKGVPFSEETELIVTIVDYLKTPYLYGGNTKAGIDCSGFTCNIFKSVYNKKLPRSADEQFNFGESVSRSELQVGDLVFFRFAVRYGSDHVGVYIGNNLFAHASSKHGVTIASLTRDYYIKRFAGARRIE